ncbi:MAG: bifunctional adenosylcobinamide kinase/adenosylcobinamide-phosphate guanylyltransferase [Clostridiales bacterium]|jgi:adenosyl cobinamide kinase/adenosyl cobinamide phosphate guanylyltransferase|nr:bifunctional adenosylcobinamide kinase/adenosylcobinamide-phosphate guanylyltransferase [Clostridiales bacterium]
MILIFGGAYQGKLDYALQRFGLTKDDVAYCTESDRTCPNRKPIVYEADKWILALLRAGEDIDRHIEQFFTDNREAIVICNDISCGVVPEDPILRKWREEVGRFMGEASQRSDEVVRLYCGIPTILKGEK